MRGTIVLIYMFDQLSIVVNSFISVQSVPNVIAPRIRDLVVYSVECNL